jgi:hypothetical protein
MKWSGIVVNLLAGAMLLFTIVACTPQIEELSFKTISQGDGFYTGQSYGEEKPGIFVISNVDEIDEPGLDIMFPTKLADELRQLDYDRFFAILVLQGQKRSSGYSVTVKKIVRQGKQVSVYAEFKEPKIGTRRTWVFTSPYHLVAVFKSGNWGQNINFLLEADGKVVAESYHFIP